MHVVVIGHIVALVLLKDRLEKVRQMILINFRDELKTCIEEALSHVHKRPLSCVAFTQGKNVEVQIANVNEL